MNNVLDYKEAIPFKRHTGGRGRHAQGKNLHAPGSQCGWPVKSVRFFVDLLRNAEANAELTIGDFSAEELEVWHVQVNRAAKRRRRTFRAHGRVGPYRACPCHIEIILKEKGNQVKKDKAPQGKIRRKKLAQMRDAGRAVGGGKVPVGGGVEDTD